jgi:electron transfer flavoprotein beta subunit
MRIIVAVKVVPDDQDIIVRQDRTLDYSRAHADISLYDLNAIEAATLLKESIEGSTLTAITIGPAFIDDSKLKKNILARGADRLYMAADDGLANLDARQTACALAALLAQVEDGWDLVICGDGSADEYAQQVDVQLGHALGLPVINAVTALEGEDGGAAVLATRTLEQVSEKVRLTLPAVLSVSPEVALPRIAGMKDILAAGKKPMQVSDAAALGNVATAARSISEPLAPVPAPRSQQVFDDLDDFVAAAAAALKA